MKLHEFEIGKKFAVCRTDDVWLCTDKGIRIITTINLSQHVNAMRDFAGAPYSAADMVFDKHNIGERLGVCVRLREGIKLDACSLGIA